MPAAVIVIDPRRFMKLWRLSCDCARIDSFDEARWARGAREILSEHVLVDGVEYELRVDWRL